MVQNKSRIWLTVHSNVMVRDNSRFVHIALEGLETTEVIISSIPGLSAYQMMHVESFTGAYVRVWLCDTTVIGYYALSIIAPDIMLT